MNAQMERLHGQGYETDPHNLGLHSVVEGAEGDQRHRDGDNDHEKKSVLKKVKAKAKKIKDTITKHAHGHDHDRGAHHHDQGEEEEEDDNEEMDEDLVIHAHTVSGDQQTNAPNLGRLVPGQEDYMNPSRTTGDTTEQKGASRQLRDDIGRPADLKEDTNAPRADEEPVQHQSKVVDPTGNGGKEVGITPILPSLDKMKVYDETTEKSQPTDGQDEAVFKPSLAPEERDENLYSGSHDQFLLEAASGETKKPEAEHRAEEKVEGSHQQERGYTEKIAAATSLVVDKAAQATHTVAANLGYGGGNERDTATGEEGKSASVIEYGKKAVTTVQDKLAPVYDKVDAIAKGHDTGAQEDRGGEVSEKGVTVKGYIAEKLKPSDEDKALAEAISGALHTPREETKGRVTESEEVVQRLGKTDERTEEQTGSPGKGTVDKFKSAVTSWFGRGGETHPGQAFVDYPKGEDDQGKEDDRTGVESSEESAAL